MQQPGLWETADLSQLMRPMLVRVCLRSGAASGPAYERWRKRFVFHLSLLGLGITEQDGRLVIGALRGGDVGLKRRTRVLDWLLRQDDVTEVQCAWPRPNEGYFRSR